MTERDIQSLISVELSRRGCFVQRTNVGTFYNIPSWAFKFDKPVFLAQWIRGNVRPVKIGIPGQSDLCGHRPVDGRAFYIEVKKPGEKPRENQERFLQQMRDSGALAGVAHSAEEAVSIVFGGERDGMDKR